MLSNSQVSDYGLQQPHLPSLLTIPDMSYHRRDSRSADRHHGRSPRRDHRSRDWESRHSRRSQPFQEARRRSRTPPPNKEKFSNFRPPKTWKMTEDEWDSNKIYGLTLFRIVANNRCTRELGIEGLPVFDVPLVSVIAQQHENWALRMMAHGRCVSWENFRSRQESVFAGILLRLIRGDLVSPDGQDFVTIMNAEHKKRHPQKELHDWEARYDTLKHVAEELAVEFRKRAPVRANAALLGRLQELEIENAALKRPSSTSTPPGRKAIPKSSASVPTSSDKSGKGSTKRSSRTGT